MNLCKNFHDKKLFKFYLKILKQEKRKTKKKKPERMHRREMNGGGGLKRHCLFHDGD